MIDSQSAFAEVHRRDGERWFTELVRGIDAMLVLDSVPLTIAMSTLYEGIPLPDPRLPTASDPD